MTWQEPWPPFDLSEYRHLGDPLAVHELTRADRRRQAEYGAMVEHVHAMVATLPPLSNDQINGLAVISRRIA